MVEEGKIVNLLLLNSNPLKSVEAWDSIKLIILHGKVIERDKLLAKNLASKT